MALELDLTTTDPTQRLLRRVTELEKRIVNLERERFAVPISSAPQTTDAGEGAIAGQILTTTAGNLWIKMGGRWYFTGVSGP
jgi:hypothetical protein